MAEFKSVRRYYLHQRRRASEEDSDLALVWRAKQEGEPGVALPATFPHKAALEAAFYTTTEDLDGTDENELVEAGLSKQAATEVLAAL